MSPGSQTARYTQTHMLVYTTTTITTVLRPLYRSTYISRHLQVRTGGFCWCKVLHAHMLAYVVSLSLGILHECTRTQMLAEPSSALLQRTGGDHRTTWMKNIHDDLSSLDLGIHEARDLVENRPLWRLTSLHSDMHL